MFTARPAPPGARACRRRQLAAAACAVTAAAALAACSSASSAPPPAAAGAVAAASPASAPLKSITFINPAPAQPGWQIAAQCFTQAARAAGVTPKVVGSPGASTSTSDQLNFIDQAVADGTGGIVAESFTGAPALEGAFASARAKGILVATVESGDATQARNFDVGLDIVKFGRDDADEVASLPGARRVALLLPGLTGTPKIFEDAFDAEAGKPGNVSVVQVVSDDGDVTRDADLVTSLLTAHPDITDIVTVNPGSTAGAATAIQEAGAAGKTFLLGNSIAEPAPEALKDGVASAFYAQRICDVGTLAVRNMIAASQDKTVPAEVPVGTRFITKASVGSLNLKEWN